MSERRVLRAVQAGGLWSCCVLRACGQAALTLVTGVPQADATGADAQVLAARVPLPGSSVSGEISKRALWSVPLQLNDVQMQLAADYLAPFSLFARKTFGVRPQGRCANMVRV